MERDYHVELPPASIESLLATTKTRPPVRHTFAPKVDPKRAEMPSHLMSLNDRGESHRELLEKLRRTVESVNPSDSAYVALNTVVSEL